MRPVPWIGSRDRLEVTRVATVFALRLASSPQVQMVREVASLAVCAHQRESHFVRPRRQHPKSDLLRARRPIAIQFRHGTAVEAARIDNERDRSIERVRLDERLNDNVGWGESGAGSHSSCQRLTAGRPDIRSRRSPRRAPAGFPWSARCSSFAATGKGHADRAPKALCRTRALARAGYGGRVRAPHLRRRSEPSGKQPRKCGLEAGTCHASRTWDPCVRANPERAREGGLPADHQRWSVCEDRSVTGLDQG